MIATYRVQLTPDFDFDRAAGIVDYLASLGVSHLYASPYLQAKTGSTHGYDVVDQETINVELGGEQGRNWLVRTLAENGMGHILDIVPNHMAIGTAENRWWWDVLENGPSSRYAAFFDVDWEYPVGEAHNRILLPILGDRYGRVLESGSLGIERRGGSFILRYFDNVLPLAPRSIADLLTRAADATESEELGFLASALARLPGPEETDQARKDRRHRDKEIVRRYLAELLDSRPILRRAVEAEVEALVADFDRLDEMHEAQNYRLAYWRLARSDLGYRRFFDINSLIGLRMEDPLVFYTTHRRVLEWLADGSLSGVRVDHPDGLRDPTGYLERLRAEAPDALIFVEKILERDEPLPTRWPVEGTTGYDFLNVANQFLIDPAGEGPLTDFYAYYTGEQRSFGELLTECKRRVIDELLTSDLNRIVELVLRIFAERRRLRDYSRAEVSEALREILVAFPVYRTYVGPGEGPPREIDAAVIDLAVRSAQATREEIDGDLPAFLSELLKGQVTGRLEEDVRLRFQQLSGPVMAKGAEDTAFYRYNRFVALNEVGGDPEAFGRSAQSVHDFLSERQASWPRAMNAGSTHDTKRGEDTRARLAVLSEMPDAWQEFVHAASVITEADHTHGMPDRNLEYQFYQNLVGTWPIDVERILQATEKSMKEAKTHTSWTAPDPAYEDAVRSFVRGALGREDFVTLVDDFVGRIVHAGRRNSVMATLLRMTAPGIPDIYQGCETWSHSLVDPDNRRTPDYLALRALAESPPEIATTDDDWNSGRVKMLTIRTALAIRRQYPEDFGPTGAYLPLEVTGDGADCYLFFRRGRHVVVGLRRFPLRGEVTAAVELPAGRYRNAFTGGAVPGGRRELPALFGDLPGTLLTAQEEETDS